MIRLGSSGQHVAVAQKLLRQAGYDVFVDGIFGTATASAVKLFQRQNGLVPDGILGPKSMSKLKGPESGALSESDYLTGANRLGAQPAMIKAFAAVESRGNGFLPNGDPVILFERHIMRRRLRRLLSEDELEKWMVLRPDLVNSRPGGYLGGIREWERLRDAAKINKEAALESASWGMFQVMGFHWQRLGYSSVFEFTTVVSENEVNQFEIFLRFIETDPELLRAVRTLNFPRIAELYNGPNYAVNEYDKKLKEFYERFA